MLSNAQYAVLRYEPSLDFLLSYSRSVIHEETLTPEARLQAVERTLIRIEVLLKEAKDDLMKPEPVAPTKPRRFFRRK